MQTLRHTLAALALLTPLLSHAAGDAGSCRYVPIAKLPIDYSTATQRAIVDGSINGKPARLIVDTGAFKTGLFRSAAERLGLRLDMTNRHIIGIGGTSLVYSANLDDFALGNLHSGKAPVDVIGNSANINGDALVGDDFLLQTDMELSLAENYLQFFRASGCADTYLAYWTSDAMEIPFAGKEDNSNKPYVTVEVNGVKLNAILDTGAPGSSITRHGAELAGIHFDGTDVRKAGTSGGIGSEKVGSWFAKFDTVSIGQETVKHVELLVHEDSSRGHGAIDFILGTDYLRTHRILFAMSQDRLYVSYLGGDPFPPRERRSPAPLPPSAPTP